MSKKVRSALSPEAIEAGQAAAANAGAKADFSAEGYGRVMAEEYLKGLAGIGVTWQEGVIHLLKTCNDTQQEKAMSAALSVAQKSENESFASNLKKRISEARRVFKASRNDYKGTLDAMTGTGSWHQKVAALPKAATTGRKKGQGAGKTTAAKFTAPEAVKTAAAAIIGKGATEAQVVKLSDHIAKVAKAATAEATKAAEVINAAKGSERIAKQDVGAIVGAVKALSFKDARTVLDVVLFHLSTSNNKMEAETAKFCMEKFTALDNGALKAAVA